MNEESTSPPPFWQPVGQPLRFECAVGMYKRENVTYGDVVWNFECQNPFQHPQVDHKSLLHLKEDRLHILYLNIKNTSDLYEKLGITDDELKTLQPFPDELDRYHRIQRQPRPPQDCPSALCLDDCFIDALFIIRKALLRETIEGGNTNYRSSITLFRWKIVADPNRGLRALRATVDVEFGPYIFRGLSAIPTCAPRELKEAWRSVRQFVVGAVEPPPTQNEVWQHVLDYAVSGARKKSFLQYLQIPHIAEYEKRILPAVLQTTKFKIINQYADDVIGNMETTEQSQLYHAGIDTLLVILYAYANPNQSRHRRPLVDIPSFVASIGWVSPCLQRILWAYCELEVNEITDTLRANALRDYLHESDDNFWVARLLHTMISHDKYFTEYILGWAHCVLINHTNVQMCEQGVNNVWSHHYSCTVNQEAPPRGATVSTITDKLFASVPTAELPRFNARPPNVGFDDSHFRWLVNTVRYVYSNNQRMQIDG